RVRADAWKKAALSKPLWLRRLYARWYRFKSGLDKRGKPAEIMDVNPAAVTETMRHYGVECLIDGHTHRPAVHELMIDNKPCLRFVLPEWGCNETVLCWNPEGFYMEAIE